MSKKLEDTKIVFFGTPNFASNILEEIINSNIRVECVVTNEDKSSGRGMKKISSPVKQVAQKYNIEILQPKKLKNNNEIIEKLKKLDADYFLVVAYGKIFPKDVLDIPKNGCINVHGSLLPKLRGASPVQMALINGYVETGITTMYMNEKMDEGDILLQEKVKISDEDNAKSLFEKLQKIGGRLLISTIEKLNNNEIISKKQDESKATYTRLLTKEDSKINIEKFENAREIFNYIRGLVPFLKPYIFINNKKYIINESQVILSKDFENIKEYINLEEVDKENHIYLAKYLEKSKSNYKFLIIQCKKDYLKIENIQPENKKMMSIQAFLQGNSFKN